MNVPENRRVLRKRKGSIVILFVAALGVIFGASALSVDYGRLVMYRWKLQTAVDSGALGGAQELIRIPGETGPDYQSATAVSQTLGNSNTPADYAVSFPDGKACRVTGTLNLQTFFASLVGIPRVTVSAEATARLSPAGGGTGVRPFGIEEPLTGFVFGETYLLKLGPKDATGDTGYAHHGNFHAVAIGGRGANVYRNNIKYGSDEIVRVGDWIDTEPGNMSGPTDDGVDYILQQEIIEEGVDYIMDQDHIAWEWYVNHPEALRDSPRVITVPVIGDWSGAYGRSLVEVVGFANFFLEGVGGKGKDCQVYGRFVEKVLPHATGGGGTGDYGAYAVGLVE